MAFVTIWIFIPSILNSNIPKTEEKDTNACINA
jgi:hypothetical protein